MSTNRQASIRLVRGQSINLATRVVTEGNTTDRNWTVSEGATARKAARRQVQLDACLDGNDLRALAMIFNGQ